MQGETPVSALGNWGTPVSAVWGGAGAVEPSDCYCGLCLARWKGDGSPQSDGASSSSPAWCLCCWGAQRRTPVRGSFWTSIAFCPTSLTHSSPRLSPAPHPCSCPPRTVRACENPGSRGRMAGNSCPHSTLPAAPDITTAPSSLHWQR